MNWDDLRHFAAFAERGSFLAAARALGVEHATVARRIDSLEQSLKLKLVDRRGRKLQLTVDGKSIAAIARRMDSEAAGIFRVADSRQQAVRGDVTISVPPALGTMVIAPHLPALAKAHPDLTVRLQSEARQVSLDRREADIAIRLKRPEEGDLMLVKLLEIRFRLYASRLYLTENPRESWQFIGSTGDLATSPQQLRLEMLAEGRRFAFWTGEVAMQLELAASHGGIAMLPDFLSPETCGLLEAIPDEPPLTREVWLVVHNDLRHALPVRTVIDHLKSTVGSALSPTSIHRP